MGISIIIEDNTEEVKQKIMSAYEKGLEAVGLAAEGYAKQKCPVDTGLLRSSITHEVDDLATYIGTNTFYAKYVEYGTGRNSSIGGNPNIAGMKPRPFLKPAATEHKTTYRNIIKNALQEG